MRNAGLHFTLKRHCVTEKPLQKYLRSAEKGLGLRCNVIMLKGRLQKHGKNYGADGYHQEVTLIPRESRNL